MQTRDNRSKNAFAVLKDIADNVNPKEKEEEEHPTKDTSALERMETQQMEIVEEEEDQEMELGELDIDAIEDKFGKKGKGYVSRR